MSVMNVSLPDDLLAELKSLVPARQRSSFIAEAIRARLSLIEQVNAVRETAGSWSSEDRLDPTDEVRLTREGWDRHTDSRGDK